MDLDIDTSNHAQFREYSSNQGRWMSMDPYSGSYNEGDPQSFNRYEYTLNNPVAYTDPLGLDSGIDTFYAGNCVIQVPWQTYPVDNTTGGGDLNIAEGISYSAATEYCTGTSNGSDGTSSSGPSGVTAPSKRQPTKPRCPPSKSQPTTDLGRLVNVYSSLTHPLEMLGANGFMFATSGILYAGAGLAVAGGCLDPTPFEPATCIAGVAAGGVTATAATGAGAAAVLFFKTVTLPAFKEWGCPD